MKIQIKNLDFFNELILRHGYTKKKFAELIGYSEPMVNQTCQGRKYISPKFAQKTLELFNLQFDDLFEIVKLDGLKIN